MSHSRVFLGMSCCKYHQNLEGALWNCLENQENICCSFVHGIRVDITMNWLVAPWITRELLIFLLYNLYNNVLTSWMLLNMLLNAFEFVHLEQQLNITCKTNSVSYKSCIQETTLLFKVLTQFICMGLIIIVFAIFLIVIIILIICVCI